MILSLLLMTGRQNDERVRGSVNCPAPSGCPSGDKPLQIPIYSTIINKSASSSKDQSVSIVYTLFFYIRMSYFVACEYERRLYSQATNFALEAETKVDVLNFLFMF